VPKGRSHPYYELFVTGDLKHIVITYGNKVSDSVMPMIDAKVIATSDLHHLSLKTVISHIMHVCEPNEGPEHQRVGNVIRIGNTICEIQDDAV
jgi:hypothetical protein